MTQWTSAQAYPWLAASEGGFRRGMDLEGLKLRVARESDGVAAAAAAFLLKIFHDQLARLVGSALTRQLIGASLIGYPAVNAPSKVI